MENLRGIIFMLIGSTKLEHVCLIPAIYFFSQKFAFILSAMEKMVRPATVPSAHYTRTPCQCSCSCSLSSLTPLSSVFWFHYPRSSRSHRAVRSFRSPPPGFPRSHRLVAPYRYSRSDRSAPIGVLIVLTVQSVINVLLVHAVRSIPIILLVLTVRSAIILSSIWVGLGYFWPPPRGGDKFANKSCVKLELKRKKIAKAKFHLN